jgi:hypothetical protein
MRRVWKKSFVANSVKDGTFSVFIEAPANAKPISVGVQNGEPVVWFECEESNVLSGFTLFVVGTGHGRVPSMATFLGTVQQGSYVRHVYV